MILPIMAELYSGPLVLGLSISFFLKCGLKNACAGITWRVLVKNTNAESESLEIRHGNLNFNNKIFFNLLDFAKHWVPMNAEFPLVCISSPQ